MKNNPLLAVTLFIAIVVLSGCKKEKPEKRPNILFAISDDQSFGHTGFGGSNWIKTPAFDRLAANGIYFRNCYAGSPGCAPSRSAIITGRHHWQNEQAGQHAAGWPKKYIPFVDLVKANGYYTGRTGKGVSPFKYGAPYRAEDAAGKGYNEIKYEENSPGDERFTDKIRNLNYFANFRKFMEGKSADQPFFFWYGASEPHRDYEEGSWKRYNKSLAEVDIPDFLPDAEKVRGDLLDYAVEIEWFDLHLQRMIDYLEETGELENTIIVVTADNGMPFPRAKANGYEFGLHVPLVISCPKRFPGGREVADLIGFVDLAPTILDLTGTSAEGMLPMSGKSFVNILESDQAGVIDGSKDFVLAGRERHSSSRYMNVGYPQRMIRKDQYLYIWNMKPERWPAGAPQRLVPDSTGVVYPMYGIDKEGTHHSEWAFTDIDACPTKSFIVEQRTDTAYARYFEWAVAKRPVYELYDVVKDPGCINNLATSQAFAGIADGMRDTMLQELKASGDPRVVGPDEGLFDTYKRYSRMREFPKPDWAE